MADATPLICQVVAIVFWFLGVLWRIGLVYQDHSVQDLKMSKGYLDV